MQDFKKPFLAIALFNIFLLLSCDSKLVNKTNKKQSTPQNKNLKIINTFPSPNSAKQKNKNSQLDLTKSTITIPLHADKWHSLKYKSIPTNKVKFSKEGILIQVKNSASPLIYPITHSPLHLTGITIEGSVDRLLQIENASEQGEKGLDDFQLRVGFVLTGDKQLNWLERQIAASWILKLHQLAPQNQGIDHIYFLSAALSPTLLHTKRTHPLSSYIKEHYVWLMQNPGNFTYSYHFQDPKKTAALWIASDGDDTLSTFNLEIKKIKLFKKAKN